jgi:PAS domain S-box-containing protein
MKIKTRLKLNSFISLGVLILILLSLAWSFHEMSIATRNLDQIAEMRKVAFERIILRDDYLLNQEARARTQWLAKSDALRRLLEFASDIFTSSYDQALLKEARGNFDITLASFSKFMEDHEREGRAVKGGFVFNDAESRLIGQVFINAYALNDNLNRLYESASKTRTAARDKGLLAVIVAVIGGMLASIINTALTNKILTKRIVALGKGIEIIGAGDLDYRIGVEGDDELTALALAGNEMAAKLKGSHTAVGNLLREIEENKRVEDALRESEGKYRTLVENIPQKIFTKDRRSVFVSCNDNFARDLGITPEEIAGKSDYDFFPKELVDKYRSDDERILESGETEGIEDQYMLGSEKLWIYTVKTPLRDKEGHAVGILGVFSDITERKRAEEALRASEDRFRIASETSNDVVYEWDLKQNVQWFGKIDEMLGFAPGEFPRTLDGWAASLHPEDLERVTAAIQAHLKEKVPFDSEYRVRSKDGDYRWWAARGATARTPEGTPVRWVGTVTDITERIRAEEVLRESERRLREAQKMAQLGHWSWDIRSGNVEWSDEVYNIFHLDQSKFTPQIDSILALSPWPEDHERDRELIRKAMYSHEKGEYEQRFLRPDGSTGYYFSTFQGKYDLDGNLVSIIGTVLDITERKRMAEALAIQSRIANIFLTAPDDEMFNEVLKVILEIMQSPFGVFGFIDESGALEVPTMTRQIWDKCQVPEKTLIFPREEWGCSSWPRALREKRTILCNGPSINIPEGHVGIQRHISLPIQFRGEVIGLFQVANKATDYTEADICTLEEIAGHVASILSAQLDRLRAEEQLKRTLSELERSNKELEQFAYVASHDLQEPLRMVASYTQLLAQRYEGQLDDKAKKFIDYAVDGAVRMQRLINDLLAYSRLNTQGKTPEKVDSHAVLGEALRNLSTAIEENRAIVINDDLPIVRADATQLLQLFQNLIGNAIKFRSGESPRIQVSACDLGREWRFSVKDNGIGIDPQFADKVFVIFQRLHTRQEYSGTGIGLAICKRIVERHGGRIWFESEPGKGSTFYFTLPKGKETA